MSTPTPLRSRDNESPPLRKPQSLQVVQESLKSGQLGTVIPVIIHTIYAMSLPPKKNCCQIFIL